MSKTKKSHDAARGAQRPGGKRSRLTGGALSEEAISSSDAVLSSAGYGSGVRGLQQFFSPKEAAELAFAVMGGYGEASATDVLDPTAGDGSLIAKWPRERRYGIEIDKDHVTADAYTAIHGDLQRVYPLLRLAGVAFSAVCLNPPFGLTWTDPAGGKKLSSMVLSLRFALGLISDRGQGMLIAGRDRLFRELADRPEARGIYAVIECDDLFESEDVALKTAIAFFVRAGNREDGETVRLRADRSELPTAASEVIEARGRLSGPVERWGYGRDDLREAFRAVQKEHDRRLGDERSKSQRYDVSAKGGRLRSHTSAFAQLALKERGALREVRGLNGKSLHYFSLNLREWRQLKRAADEGALVMDPALPGQVECVVREAEMAACPLYPVRPQMRLGYLEDLESIRCRKDDPKRGFLEGESYPLTTRTKVTSERGTKLVETRAGDRELRRFERERKLLEIRVGTQVFDEGPGSIAHLIEHFEIPDPGDLESRYPHEVARAQAMLEEIAIEHGFRFKRFQLDDLARLVVKGKGVLAHEMGLGKTLQQLAFAEAMVRRGAQSCALFVVPQDLIPQWQREARRFFDRELKVISTVAEARRVAKDLRRGGKGWYITHYEALSIVGRRDEPLPEVEVLRKGERRFVHEQGDELERVESLTSAEFCPSCRADMRSGWRQSVCDSCGYVHKRIKVRTIASFLSTAFSRGVICVDELTMIRGDDALRSKAVRGLRARHPLGATGTPIANYVNDCFFGLWWSLGNANERFPYDHSGKAQFERDFCVIEYLMGREADREEHLRKRRKILPEVTNLSILWRLLSSAMIRRRKEDTGEPLVERTYYPVRVPFGERQLALQKKWLKDFARWFEETHPDSPIVEAGVVEKFAAGLGQLPKLEYAATLPEGDPDLHWTGIAASNWTPKTLKVLETALERVKAGDKVLIGSCLIETGRFIAERLRERGVRAVHIVEERQGRAQTKNPRKRASEVRSFIEGRAQVLCAGVQAVKLGHDLSAASSVIITGLPWSHEALSQFEARVHRLVSERPVSVYVVIVKGSLDERKWELLQNKGAASDLALDGQLVDEPEKAIDWNKVLKEMRSAGVKTAGDEVPEQEVRALWERAEGALASLGPKYFLALRKRKVAEGEAGDKVVELITEESGQIALDLAA